MIQKFLSHCWNSIYHTYDHWFYEGRVELTYTFIPAWLPLALFAVCVWMAFRQDTVKTLALTCTVGFLMRIEAWFACRYAPVAGDVMESIQLGQQSKWFWDSGWREPMWVNLQKVIHLITGSDANWSASIFSLVPSILLIPSTFIVASKIIQPRYAALAAVLVAFNKSLIYFATRGFRMDFYALILLWTFYFLYTRKNTVYTLVVVMLTRIPGMFVVFFCAGVELFRRQYKRALLYVVIPFLAVSPFYGYHHVVNGSAFHTSGSNLRWIVNLENGVEGVSAGEENISGYEYLFVIHNPLKIAQFYAKGIFNILIGEQGAYIHYIPLSPVFALLFIIGIGRFLFEKKFLLLLFIIFTLNIYPVFSGSVNLDWRHPLSLYPLMAVITVSGLQLVLKKLNLDQELTPQDSETETVSQPADPVSG